MRERLLQFIACPSCRGSLTLNAHRWEGRNIVDGALLCQACEASFPILGGIPRFVRGIRDPETAESFGFEWMHVEVTDVEEDVVTFFRKTGFDERIYVGLPVKEVTYPTLRDIRWRLDGSSLAGKLVLDAGCGMGRYLQVAKEYGCEIVGFDFSRSVERASRLLAGHDMVHVVQGDIFHPPFRAGVFDVIYSIGCLHHTPDPPAAFRSLVPLCRRGAWFSIHVYPPSFWLDPIRGSITKLLRRVTVRLPHSVLLWLCGRVALPLGLLQMRLAAHPVAKFLGAPFFLMTIPRHRKRGVMIGDTFDTYSVRYIWTYRPEDVMQWFERAGFEDVKVLPYPTTVKGRRKETV